MLNTRQLTNPSPSDINLRNGSDPLGMLRQGGYDRNRYSYYHNISKRPISNRTNDIFNHTISVGGTVGDGWNIRGKITALSKGGISAIKPPPFKPNAQLASTIPFMNGLINAPVNPKINALVDKPLPPSINPIAVK